MCTEAAKHNTNIKTYTRSTHRWYYRKIDYRGAIMTVDKHRGRYKLNQLRVVAPENYSHFSISNHTDFLQLNCLDIIPYRRNEAGMLVF